MSDVHPCHTGEEEGQHGGRHPREAMRSLSGRGTYAVICAPVSRLHRDSYADGFWVSYDPTPAEVAAADGDWWAAHKVTTSTRLEEFETSFAEDAIW